MEMNFTKENFNDEVVNSKVPVLIDFYANWCNPCRMMGPVVAKLADKYAGKIKVGKVDTDAQQELAGAFKVMSIPYFAFIKDGKVVDEAIGAMPPEALEEKVKKLL